MQRKTSSYLICYLFLFLSTVLTALRKLEDSWLFEDPVTEDIAPDYFTIIEKPMDFLTIEKKIEKGEYTKKEDVSSLVVVVTT